ncbi:MAG: dUTP diphosphatase, partial [Acidobacteria bacterium]|nr:dUTP diphosphatase [Acidobacteriota bacterium]
LNNHGRTPFSVLPGMRSAQLVLARVARVIWESADTLAETDPAHGGFGHTGLQS